VKRDEKSMLAKTKIIQAAYEAFSAKGYEAATMDDIVLAAHLSKGAIYHHFSSKQEIMGLMIEQAQEKINNFLRWLVERHDLNTKEKFSSLIAYLTENREHEQLIQNRWIEKIPFALLKNVRNTIMVVSDHIKKVIIQGVQKGDFSCQYPCEIAETVSLLFDILLDPVIVKMNYEDICDKIDFIAELLNRFDAPLLGRAEIGQIKALYKKYC